MNVLFLLGTLGIMILLAWHELNVYGRLKLQRKDTQMARARVGRRLLGLVVLFVVVTMTYFGIQNLRAFPSPLAYITYWTICLILLVFLLVLVVFDLQAVYKQAMAMMINDSAEERRFHEFMERRLRVENRKHQKPGGDALENLGNLQPHQETREPGNKGSSAT